MLTKIFDSYTHRRIMTLRLKHQIRYLIKDSEYSLKLWTASI